MPMAAPHAAAPEAAPSARRRPPRGVLIALAVLATLLVTVGALAWFGPIAHPRTVQVSGASGGDAAKISAALEEAASEQSTLNVDTAALMDAVRQYPEVAGVSVTARPPFRLDLDVVMRPAVARLQIGGRQLVVAGDGTVLRRGSGGNLPRLDNSIKGMTLKGGVVHAPEGALQVVGAAPAPLLELAKTLRTGPSGLELEMTRGPRLIFGDGDQAAEKWAAAAAVLAEGAALRGTYVDVRVPARPAVGGLAPAASSAPAAVDAPPTLGAPATGTAATAPAPSAASPTGATGAAATAAPPAATGGSTGAATAPGAATGAGTAGAQAPVQQPSDATAPASGGATP